MNCEFCEKQLKKKSLHAHKKRYHGLHGQGAGDDGMEVGQVPSTSKGARNMGGPTKKGRGMGKRKLEEALAMETYYESQDEMDHPMPPTPKAVAHVQPTTRPFKDPEDQQTHLPPQPNIPQGPPPRNSPEKRRPPAPGPSHPQRQFQGQLQGQPSRPRGPSPQRPDLQSKLGLKFGDQISITASGDESSYRRPKRPGGPTQMPPPQVAAAQRPPQTKPRPKPEHMRPPPKEHLPSPPEVKEEPEDYDDEDLMGEEEDDEDYYGDDAYYDDSEIMEGGKSNLDGAYDEDDADDVMTQ